MQSKCVSNDWRSVEWKSRKAFKLFDTVLCFIYGAGKPPLETRDFPRDKPAIKESDPGER
jgi:hypothetical protein